MSRFSTRGPKRLRKVRRETQPYRKQGWVGSGPRTRDQRRTDRLAIQREIDSQTRP